jgi:hypothetical protein
MTKDAISIQIYTRLAVPNRLTDIENAKGRNCN